MTTHEQLPLTEQTPFPQPDGSMTLELLGTTALRHGEIAVEINTEASLPSVGTDGGRTPQAPQPHSSSRGTRQKGPDQRSAPVDSLTLYLNEIGQVPLLEAEEEISLGRIVQQGLTAKARLYERSPHYTRTQQQADTEAMRAGEIAKDLFVRSNLRLVVSIAKKYISALDNGIALLDLIQSGNLGLEHAVDKFDPEKGFRFSTYATWWIRQSIARFLDENSSIVHIPRRTAEELRRFSRLNARAGHELSDPEILEELRWTPGHLSAIRAARHAQGTVSLSTPLADDKGSIGDLIADASALPTVTQSQAGEVQGQLWDTLRAILTETQVLCLYHRSQERMVETDKRTVFKQVTFAEVGQRIGTTGENARKSYYKAIKKLQEPENIQLLERFLDLIGE